MICLLLLNCVCLVGAFSEAVRRHVEAARTNLHTIVFAHVIYPLMGFGWIASGFMVPALGYERYQSLRGSTYSRYIGDID